jgi:putative phosphoribosyl transferase
MRRREKLYRGDRPFPEVTGRTVILVDDGLATGASMRAAVAALRQQDPSKLVVTVPAAPSDTCEALRSKAYEVVCLETPEPFLGVGRWYESFPQTSDEEVQDLLARPA